MSYLRNFGRFWYDFIVGDDWRVAVGVAIAVTVTFVAAHRDTNPWWFLPIAVTALLAASLHRATRMRPGPDAPDQNA
jgi:hypothetical protein